MHAHAVTLSRMNGGDKVITVMVLRAIISIGQLQRLLTTLRKNAPTIAATCSDSTLSKIDLTLLTSSITLDLYLVDTL